MLQVSSATLCWSCHHELMAFQVTQYRPQDNALPTSDGDRPACAHTSRHQFARW